MARYGYARISTRSQRDDSQLDALREAGCERIWADAASGKLARRPEWDACLDHLRAGDELVVTRLSRMARSVRHLTDIAGLLEERGIDLVVLKQGIDTTTPAGRFTFHVLAAMDEMLADLISEGTREGLAAARARGRTGGRPPTLSTTQVEVARAMYEELGNDGKRRYTVDEIAETLGVSRKTVYRRLAADGVRRQPDESTRSLRATQSTQASAAPPATLGATAEPGRHPRSAATLACPSCGHEPASKQEALEQREDLAIVWLHQDRTNGPIIEQHHCARCQPQGTGTTVLAIECARCGDGPILTGALAAHANPLHSTNRLCDWLTDHRWQLEPEPLCPNHQQ